MTAQFVNPYTRKPIPASKLRYEFDYEMFPATRCIRRGQRLEISGLWDRVKDSQPDYSLLTWGVVTADRVRAENMKTAEHHGIDVATHAAIGVPIASEHESIYLRHASGVIRAGERVK